MKKVSKLLLFCLIISICLVFFGCGSEGSEEAPPIDKSLSFHTSLQEEYLSGDYKKIASFATGDKEESFPLPIRLEFSDESLNKIIIIKEEGIEEEIRIETSDNYIEIYNLKANTTYIWSVNGVSQEPFKTKAGLRNLYVDGLTNTRDIGGYLTESGIYTNQGLLIRSSKLTDDDTGEILITEKGIETLKALGIKTELDLRSTTEDDEGNIEQGLITSSVVSGVNYISLPMKSGGNYLQLNRGMLKDLFKILANEDNYPILFHCSIGTDRTGVVSFLVNAICGVSKEDIYKDYLFSNFGVIYSVRTPSIINDYISKVTSSSRLSLKENTINYLIDQGVDRGDIEKVIEIMTKK